MASYHLVHITSSEASLSHASIDACSTHQTCHTDRSSDKGTVARCGGLWSKCKASQTQAWVFWYALYTRHYVLHSRASFPQGNAKNLVFAVSWLWVFWSFQHMCGKQRMSPIICDDPLSILSVALEYQFIQLADFHEIHWTHSGVLEAKYQSHNPISRMSNLPWTYT